MKSLGAIGPFFSTLMSFIFLLTGALALYTMMARMGQKTVSRPDVYTKIHRIAGWSFATLFVGFFIYMMTRLANYTDEFTARITFHFTLAIALLCLLAMKISVVKISRISVKIYSFLAPASTCWHFPWFLSRQDIMLKR